MSVAALPDAIGPYRLLRPIARGGMAEVYEVEDPSSGEHLALKLLVQTGGALARFNREYEAMIRLNHPNIVRVFHYGVEGESPWLTMELIDGTPIQAYAKRCGKPGSTARNEEVIRLAHDLALALDHIHRRGLLHRDLKSANVLVLPDGRVKLIDFGTARVSQAMEEITKEGEFIGTFAYASPEQLTNKAVDNRSDLYSMGVLLYRMATGKMPFRAKELHALARQHVKEAPKPPRQVNARIPEALEKVILKLLQKKPADRIQSGAEVAAALEDVAGHPLFLPQTLDVDLSSDSLVGREEQMADLWRFLDGEVETPAGKAPMALVVGLPGSGRHRVMQAIERDAKARKWRALNWFIRRGGDDLDSLIRLLVDVAKSMGDSNPIVGAALTKIQEVRRARSKSAAERLETVRMSGAKIISARAKADNAPVILLVRGVQNAGPVGFEAMVAIRDQLGREPGQFRVVADALETADDPNSKARKRLPDAMRVHLPPMSVREVALLVGSLLRRRPPPASMARRIYDASGGLPAYVEEVIKGLVGQGILRVQGRDSNRIEWAKNENLEIPVPHGARERVMDQLAELPADRRRVLETLALAGGEGSSTVLAAALQCRAVELTPALNDLEGRGWITVDRDRGAPYIRWRQILAEHVVLDQLHPCRRVVMQRLIIDEVADEPAFAAQIKLLLQVERHPEALDRALDWAAHHIAQNNPVTALEVLDLVMPHVMDVPVATDLKAALYLLHVSCLIMARPTDPHTSKSLKRATRLGQLDGGEGFQAELHLMRARIQRVIGHYPNFRKHLMEAWYLVEHDSASPVGSNVAGLLGWSNGVAGHVDDAATWHGRARRIAVQTGVQEVRAHADVGVAGWQYARGLLKDSERTAKNAIAVFGEAGDSRGLSLALPVWAHSLRLQGRLSEALGVLYTAVPEMRESEAPSFYVRLLLAKAWCEIDLCRLGSAQECVDELAATLRRGEHLDLRLEADLVWGRILLASDQIEDAHRRLIAVRDRSQAAGLRVIAATANSLIGEVLVQLNDERAAADTFRSAVDQLRISGDIPATAAACEAHARALGHRVETDKIFAPVMSFSTDQPTTMMHIVMTLARARYAKSQGGASRPIYDEATAMLGALSDVLNDTDQAALRLHPWSREARLG